MIRFDRATKRYPDGTVAVDELDLEAPSGQITVLVGPSGLRQDHLPADDQPDDRADLRHDLARRHRHREHAGPRAAAADRLRHPARRPVPAPHHRGQHRDRAASCWARTRRRPRSRAMELLERVGLDPAFAKRYPAQLSGGQQQRVGVARALAADPPVMLMDEPFSAVDPVVRDQLQDEFLRLQGELGKTIVFVTHDIDEAIKLGDQVAVLRVGGTLAQLAAPHELLSRPVDAFVAGFVGRDRGYRALGFADSGDARRPTRSPPSRSGDSAPDGSDGRPFVLVVNDRARAPGLAGPRRGSPRARRSTEELVHRGGTLATQGGTLRAALDACLSSPSGAGSSSTRRAGCRHGHRPRGARPDRAEPARHRKRRRHDAPPARQRQLVAAALLRLLPRPPRARTSAGCGTTPGSPSCPSSSGCCSRCPLGWLARRYRWLYPPMMSISGLLYTIPSIALFVLIPPLLGPGPPDPLQVPIALSLYSTALLVRVVADGLGAVPAGDGAGGHRARATARSAGSSGWSCRSPSP